MATSTRGRQGTRRGGPSRSGSGQNRSGSGLGESRRGGSNNRSPSTASKRPLRDREPTPRSDWARNKDYQENQETRGRGRWDDVGPGRQYQFDERSKRDRAETRGDVRNRDDNMSDDRFDHDDEDGRFDYTDSDAPAVDRGGSRRR